MQRTILITEVVTPDGERDFIYGKYDPITLNRQGYKIIETYRQMYVMDDKTFATYATKKGGRQYGICGKTQ